MKYKNGLITALFLAVLNVLSTGASAQGGIVKGRVYDALTNEPLPFVNVILEGTPELGTSTDLQGNYQLSGLSPGYVRLVASFLGYEKQITEEVLITRVHSVTLDIPMKQSSVQLQKVEITASAFTKREESPVSAQTLGIAEIEKNPGSNRDISRVIQALPGVATTPAYRNDVIVRGGGPSENRFYLDGVEIPNLNHFATQGASGGPVGIINADFIREVDFLSGAFPASRGNALSSVIEFRQVEGNRDKMNYHATLGATDLGLTTQGPVSANSTFLFSLRRSYLQFLFDALGLPFLPTYNDYQLKYRWNINTRNQFTLISIGALDKSKLNTNIKDPDETQRYILGYLPANDQWTYTIGGVYRHFRKNGYDTWVLSRNMLDNRAVKYKDNVVKEENKLLEYMSREIENKFRYEHTRKSGDYSFTLGGGTEYVSYYNSTFSRQFVGNVPLTIDYESSLVFWKYAVFGQVSHPYLQDRLTLSFGMRLDGNTYSDEMSDPLRQFSPRLSASYALNEKYSLNASLGRYYQLPPYTTLGFRDNSGELLNKTNGIRYIEGNHAVFGIQFDPASNARISVEGFYKRYHRYPFSVNDSVSLASKGADYGTYGDEEVRSTSDGRAYGMEILFRNRSLSGFNIIMAYTLVRSEFSDASGKYIPSSWDNIHLLNLTMTRKLKRNWDVGIKWRYTGGAPVTPYDFEKSSLVSAWDARNQGYLDYSRFNSVRLKAFHQLDVRVDKEYFFRKWSLMLYLDIQNVYNFKADQQDFLVNYDASGQVQQYTDPYGVQRYKLREIPSGAGTVLPTVGVMVEF